jgi:hypothetical protein
MLVTSLNVTNYWYSGVAEVTDRLAYDILNFLTISHSNYHLIINHAIDEIKHLFSESE